MYACGIGEDGGCGGGLFLPVIICSEINCYCITRSDQLAILLSLFLRLNIRVLLLARDERDVLAARSYVTNFAYCM